MNAVVMDRRFARVIPALKTPPGMEALDYAIPEDLALTAGDLVRIPFRRQTGIGIVESLLASSEIKHVKPISGRYGNVHLPPAAIQLLTQTSARLFVSSPTLLHAWLRLPPKRPPLRSSVRQAEPHKPAQGTYRERWTATPEADLLARARELRQAPGRILILTPWVTRAERWHQLLSGSAVLHGRSSAGQAFSAWSCWLEAPSGLLITTRLGAWLCAAADVVLIDEPEQNDYKQDELAPRYDARRLVKWSAEHAGTNVETFGLTPPLRSLQRDVAPVFPSLVIPVQTHIRHPAGRSSIPMLQGDTLNAIRSYGGPVSVIHPIRGWQARLVCRDCGWRALCERCGFALNQERDHLLCHHCGTKTSTILACPQCGGTDLGKSWPGLEKIKRAWAEQESRTDIDWRDLSAEALDRPFRRGSLAVVTDGSLLGGAGEPLRREEERVFTFRRLAERLHAAEGRLLIQCGEQLADLWERLLDGSEAQSICRRICEERSLFHYPPAFRLVKIIIPGTQAQALETVQRLKSSLTGTAWSGCTLEGPFEIPFQRRGKSERFIVQLIAPLPVDEEQLVRLLTPYAREAMIDLDPVAFFR